MDEARTGNREFGPPRGFRAMVSRQNTVRLRLIFVLVATIGFYMETTSAELFFANLGSMIAWSFMTGLAGLVYLSNAARLSALVSRYNTVTLRLILALGTTVGVYVVEIATEVLFANLGSVIALCSMASLARLVYLSDAPRLPAALETLVPVRGRWVSRMLAAGLLLMLVFVVLPRCNNRTNELYLIDVFRRRF